MKILAALPIFSAGFDIEDRPELKFPSGCTKNKFPKITSGEVPDGYKCKNVSCRNYPKHKTYVKIIDGKMSPALECLPDDKLGCEAEWGLFYKVGKKISNFPDPILPKKRVTITCDYTGESTVVACNALKAKNTPKLTFEWANSHNLACPQESDNVWASWNEWDDCNGRTCERVPVKRTRDCYNGPDGSTKSCPNSMEGEKEQSGFCWPSVCQQCHADMGLYKFDFQGKIGANKRIPWVNTAKKLIDGHMKVGDKILNGMCMQDTKIIGAKSKSCVCDAKGCNFSGGPSCSYKSYDKDYHWTPSPSDTWTQERKRDDTFVNDDFTLTYQGSEVDPRFANRVKWWEPNGPSICRVMENALLPGFERPSLKNDDGGLDWNHWNSLECDMEITKYPGFPKVSTLALGSRSYEVLTSDNKTKWVSAASAQNVIEKMVIGGNFNNGADFHEEQIFGFCRFTECTRNEGENCSKSSSNSNTEQAAENGKFHPGVLKVKNGALECASILGAGSNVKENKNVNKFDVLLTE